MSYTHLAGFSFKIVCNPNVYWKNLKNLSIGQTCSTIKSLRSWTFYCWVVFRILWNSTQLPCASIQWSSSTHEWSYYTWWLTVLHCINLLLKLISSSLFLLILITFFTTLIPSYWTSSFAVFITRSWLHTCQPTYWYIPFRSLYNSYVSLHYTHYIYLTRGFSSTRWDLMCNKSAAELK